MSGSKLTFVAEFVDRLTGPTKKAQKAVEDLGKAADDASKKSKAANDRAGRAEEKRARTTEQSARLAEQSERRRAKAAEDSGRRHQRASREAEKSEKRRTTTTQKATAQQDKAFSASAIAAERASRNHQQATQRTNRALGTTTQGANRSARAMQQMAGTTTTAANRTANVITQMAGRSANGVNMLGKSMDRLRPDTMATKYSNALNRMLGRTEQVASRIRSSLQGVADSQFVSYGAMGATAAGGFAAAGGLRRIADVQQADVVLETMGITGGDKENLMGQFKGLAQDTPFSTGSIASMGSGLISAGMDQSKMEESMRGAIDTAALFGMSLEDMALPLKQMQAKGVLQGDDLNQLLDRNIPIMGWIAEQKGVDQSQVKDMVSKGQVSADDVFAAMAANSKGGADRASQTLKGSFTNMLSAGSQLGEAFFMPMLPELTDALQTTKTTLQGLKPELQVLGKFTGLLIKGLAPFLPIIVPGLIGLGAALIGLKVASTVAAGVSALAKGSQWLSQSIGGRSGAASGLGLFAKETRYAQSDVQSLAGQRGLGGMNDKLRDSTKTMGRTERATRGLAKGFGIAAGAAIGLMAATKGMEALGKINAGASEEQLTNTLMTGGDLNKEFSGADWANHQGSILGGSMSGVSGIGDVITKQQNQSFGDKVTGFFGDGKFFGYKDGWQKGFDQLSAQDSSFAANAGTPQAGAAFQRVMDDTLRAGGSEQDVIKAFPLYKDAVLSKLTDKGIQANDGNVLQYMVSGQGFRSGGYTGDGPASAVAGAVHGREYVMPETVTSRPGMLPALREIHRTGEVPRSYHGSSATNVSVSVDARGATPDGAAAVGQSVEQAVERVLARRERRVANQHGNRALRGAN